MKSTNALHVAFVLAGIAVRPATAGSDVWLAAKAKVELLTTEGLSVKDADVAAFEGVVTLHGKVRTGAEKARAGYVVSAVAGVRSVRNLMRVAPQAFGAAGRVDDDTVRRTVDAALRADDRLEGVRVASVENGVVLLEGATENLAEKVRAIELVWAVPGVSRVTSRIEAQK